MKIKNNKSPLIYIDNEIYSYSLLNLIPYFTRGGETLRRIKWLELGHCLAKIILNLFLVNILASLSNVVCYFTSNLSGLYSVLKLLTA
jgi:hypothetical protein